MRRVSAVKNSWKESTMKCSNPDCNRGIGLIAYQRIVFSKQSLLFKALPRCVRG